MRTRRAAMPDPEDTRLLAWPPFPVMFNCHSELVHVVGPDERDPYDLFAPGDVWRCEAADEAEGAWIVDHDLSFEAALVAKQAAEAHNAIGRIDGEWNQALATVITLTPRLSELLRTWTAERLDLYVGRELTCPMIQAVAQLVHLADPIAALALLDDHASIAEKEWTDPNECDCAAVAGAMRSASGAKKTSDLMFDDPGDDSLPGPADSTDAAVSITTSEATNKPYLTGEGLGRQWWRPSHDGHAAPTALAAKDDTSPSQNLYDYRPGCSWCWIGCAHSQALHLLRIESSPDLVCTCGHPRRDHADPASGDSSMLGSR